QIAESSTQNTRSFLRSLGTPFFLLSTPSCCRKARFSRARSPRSLRAATMRIASHRSISIMEREYGGNELRNQRLSSRRNFGDNSLESQALLNVVVLVGVEDNYVFAFIRGWHALQTHSHEAIEYSRTTRMRSNDLYKL